MFTLDLESLLTPKACLALSVLGTVIILAGAALILQRLSALEEIVQVQLPADMLGVKTKADGIEASVSKAFPRVLQQLNAIEQIVSQHLQHHADEPKVTELPEIGEAEELKIAEKVIRRLEESSDSEAEQPAALPAAEDGAAPAEDEAPAEVGDVAPVSESAE